MTSFLLMSGKLRGGLYQAEVTGPLYSTSLSSKNESSCLFFLSIIFAELYHEYLKTATVLLGIVLRFTSSLSGIGRDASV